MDKPDKRKAAENAILELANNMPDREHFEAVITLIENIDDPQQIKQIALLFHKLITQSTSIITVASDRYRKLSQLEDASCLTKQNPKGLVLN